MAESAAEAASLPVELFMDIDRASPVPLYFQLASRIEQAIGDGTLRPGARLENEIALGDRLGLSRPTVRRAIQELVAKGLLVRRRGLGTQVVQRPLTRKVELTSLYDDLQQGSRHPATELLSRAEIGADERIAEILSVEPGSPILHIRRLRSADEVPLAVLENFLPAEFVDISAEDLRSRGLYQLLRARGTTMSVARQRIGARSATLEESKLLDIRARGPVLTMDRTAFSNNGKAIEYGHHCYRPDLYAFETTLVNK
nr:GntR family transcriptional regulator [Actinospica acidithermotolerans]